MNDFADGLPSDKYPKMPDKLSEAYRSFCALPPSHRLTYLLHLLGMKPHLMAPIQGSDEETVKEQLAETEAILQHHFKAMEPEQIESMMRCLLEINASSPPPLNELAGLVAEAKSLRSFVVDYDEILESKTVPPRSTAKMTHAECTEADRVLFNLPLSIREVFALRHVAELDEREIANVLRIADSEVERYLFLGRAIMSQLMEGLVVGFLRWKAATPEERRSEEFRMSKTERNTARSTWRLLPMECRSLVRWHLFRGLSVQEIAKKTGLDAEFVDGMIEFTREQLVLRVETLVTAWLRSNLPPGATVETILQKLQADSFIEEESVPAPKRTLSIGEAEISVAETTLYEMKTLEREAFELFAVDCTPGKIASILEMGPEEVRKNLRSARRQLGDRLERLVTALMQRRMRLPYAPKLDGEETAAAKAVFKTIPKSCQKPFVLFMATGFSVEEIAETLGLLPYQVRERISKAKKAIRIRAIQAANAWVRQGEEIETARQRVLGFHKMISLLREIPEISEREASATVLEPEPDFSYIQAELDEIETAIGRLDFEIREAFVLGFGAGLDPSEIAAIQETDEKETFRRLKEGIETVRDQVERLIVAWLRRRFGAPNVPRLKPTEGLAAKQAYMEIPEEFREAFVRFRVKGESAQEIAAAFQVYTGKVEDWLEQAEHAITSRALQLAAQALGQVRDDRPVGEILLGDPKQIRFPSSVWENAGIEIPAEHILSETPIINTPPKNLAYDVIPPKETQAEKSCTVMASFSGLGLLPLSDAIKTFFATIGTTGFMVATALFLWPITAFMSGQVSVFAFIRTAPTLEARRWLTEKLFYIYSLVFAGPQILLLVLTKIGLVNPNLRQFFIPLYLGFFFCILFVIFFQTAQTYNKLCVLQNQSLRKKYSFSKLYFIVNAGFSLHTLIVSQVLWEIAKEVFPKQYESLFVPWRMRSLLLASLIGVIHATYYFLFRYFLHISKDEKSFQETPPIAISAKMNVARRRILEFVRILPFALFPIAMGIGHLLTKNTRPLCNVIEIMGFSILWAFAWYMNMTTGKRKMIRVLIYFIIQLAFMAYMRSNYYNTW